MDPLTLVLVFVGLSLLLITMELFIPSGGVLGGLSALSLVGAIVSSFFVGIQFGWGMLLASIIIVPTAFWLFIRYWPTTKMGQRFVMAPTEPSLLVDEQRADLEKLIGRQGISQSEMLPSGSVLIESQSYGAISEGLPIEEGVTVEVIEVRMHTLVVRKFDGEWSPTETGSSSAKTRDAESSPEKDAENTLSQPLDSLGLADLDDLLED